MRFLVLAALVAAAGAMVVKDGDFVDIKIGKDLIVNKDMKFKQLMIMKLLNHILQPCMYDDIKTVAMEWDLEQNTDKYLKMEVVKDFLDMYLGGMLPRGEMFVHSSRVDMDEVVKVFHLLYFAKDFDTFIRTACWLRDRINEGMFVYAVTVAVLHREDCRGIVLPAPYEIYPYFFVNSDVIHKVFMMKMKRGVLDPVLLKYYNIKVTDKNVVVIDSRKGVRHALTKNDRLAYFMEDIDLNSYYYYFLMDYPQWMSDDKFDIKKERYGEVLHYGMMQLMARLRLERLSHEMCDIKSIMWDKPLKTGYWPKIRMHNGEEMPVRVNNKIIVTEDNVHLKRMIDDLERLVRDAVLTGHVILRDGTELKIKKDEDIEVLCRLAYNHLGWKDDKKVHLLDVFVKLLNYNDYMADKRTYIPTAMDIHQTSLRDPVFWQLLKRFAETIILFKKVLPHYTREELDFPGVKIESVDTDKLVTFFDDYDMDITNAVYLDETEVKNRKSDFLFVARQRRLNHHSFKLNVEVMSDKTTDAVVRVFLGPKYDCMGRLMNINDKRLDMFEIDSFVYKLKSGKNVIVRDSLDMHNVIDDKMWTRKLWDRSVIETHGMSEHVIKDTFWSRARTGFPHRLLLPMGRRGGLEMQLYVIMTPVRMNNLAAGIDIDTMKSRHTCRFSSCIDSMSLGFPFDRVIMDTIWWTPNMKLVDVMIYHKDLDMTNTVKTVDMSRMKMRRDDLTYMDKDMLVNSVFINTNREL